MLQLHGNSGLQLVSVLPRTHSNNGRLEYRNGYAVFPNITNDETLSGSAKFVIFLRWLHYE